MTDKSAAAVRKLAEHWMPMVRYKDKERFISVLTALIEEHYVSKEEYNEEKKSNALLHKAMVTAEKGGHDKAMEEISEHYYPKEKYDELLRQRDELREALAEMIWQFGYRSTYEGRESLHTGGLSALESAFDALGLSDPIALLDFEAAIKTIERK